MQDWPEELNVSKFDEGYKGEEAEEADAKTSEDKDNAASKDDEPRHPNKQ